MGDGGYIFDDELSPEFLEFQKFDYWRLLGKGDFAMKLIIKNFDLTEEELKRIIEKYGGKIERIEISTTWDGYCPESLFKGKQVRMRLNQYDFYESEETGLQIAMIPGVQAIILNFRGHAKFRKTATFANEIENGELLSPQNTERPPFNQPTEIFLNSQQIENYINNIPKNEKHG